MLQLLRLKVILSADKCICFDSFSDISHDATHIYLIKHDSIKLFGIVYKTDTRNMIYRYISEVSSYVQNAVVSCMYILRVANGVYKVL